MLLRSSSTPVLGSLLSSFAESTGNSYHHHQSEVPNSKGSPYFHHNYSKLSYSKHAGSPNLTTSLYNSSPVSPSIVDLSGSGFRRAQSDGNLEALGSATSSNDVDEFSFSNPSKKFARKPHSSTLEAIPSFSFQNSNGRHLEDEDSDEEGDVEEQEFKSENTDPFRGSLCSFDSVGFKTEDRKYRGGYGNVVLEEMYLARGLGIADIDMVCNGGYGGGGGGGGGGEGCRPVAYDGDGGDKDGLGIEEHYKRLLEENPSNPLYLRNYAQFLHQTKRDVKSAEEYYSRAILADPKDGEVLSQYATLLWEFYQDKDRATNYFEQAVQASAEDSHVHAAYASFLWEIEDEDEDASNDIQAMTSTLIKEGITT